ncbi:MAG: bifunctional folylpolyglutamate synthase/dihydrofolate synthase [Dehalococcoidia bacterium]|nr:bifunctional folylpolyglutamate synthase/dihydrofolate synthase [Dehalococcoidia bacterium]
MDYRQAENYILSFTDYEKLPGIAYTSANYDLRRMEKLLQPLGNPHLGTRTVHIAGTKGKGSTAAMISQILIAAGYRTGLFTSPHLHTLRERIRINGEMISEADFASIVAEIKPLVESINKRAAFGKLTTFEILTAVVFTYFKKKRVDFQVLEVGLGGRLDATNVVKPDVCVITSLSLDHTEILGNTIAKIAAEKSGIIKPGCIVINAPQVDEAAQVVNQVCHQQQAKLIQVGQDVTWNKTGGDLYGQTLTVSTKSRYYDLTIPLLGDYQLENAATAVAAIEALAAFGAGISARNIVKGFGQVNWPGRLQILKREPMVVVDGAHNAYSMGKLAQAVKECFHYKRCFVIFGTSCDKDISGMAQELEPLSNHIIITSSYHPRAASILSLAEKFNSLGIKSVAADNVAEALAKALALAIKTDLILITGSLFVVAEAIDYITEAKSPVVADDIK